MKECKEFRSTRRIANLKSQLEAESGLLEQSRARLARLEVQQAAPVRDSVVRDGPQVSVFATDGDPVASRTRFFVPGVAPQSWTSREAMRRRTSECQRSNSG